MGCDIHAFLEMKVDGKWLQYAPIDMQRNYALFSKMAGVRGHVEPIDTPRGLPKNVSEVVQLHRDRWGRDGHSDSWLSAKEISELAEWADMNSIRIGYFEDKFCTFSMYFFGNTIESWIKYRSEYPAFVEDIRLVFWFDN